MFTGIVQSVGVVRQFCRNSAGARLTVATGLPAAILRVGDSIAVDGCCQTVVEFGADGVCVFDCLEETLSRTIFGDYESGRRVNIEPALAAGDRLGGHIVQGHVDATAEVLAIQRRAGDLALTIRRPAAAEFLLVEKGSIAISGVSLTIAAVTGKDFTVCIIPHTWEATALSSLKVGSRVNLESDILGKYVQAVLKAAQDVRPSVTLEQLHSAGF